MRRAAILALLITVPWVVLFGLIELVLGNGVMEVIAVELAAVALSILTTALMVADVVDDVLGPHS